jgi:hypothetical protein
MHWGATPGADGRPDFPLHDWAMAQQGSLLGQLLDPAVLSRVRDAELRAQPDEATLGLPELYASLTGAIWSEVGAGVRGRAVRARSVSSVRRDLQRLYLNLLIQTVVNPAPGTPEDARAIARSTLAALGTDLDRAMAVPRADLDAYTRAHLADSRDRIARALDAQMIQTTTISR